MGALKTELTPEQVSAIHAIQSNREYRKMEKRFIKALQKSQLFKDRQALKACDRF